MNLGQLSIHTFLALGVATAVLSLFVALVLARLSRRRMVGVATFCVVFVLLGWPCSRVHQTVFTYWHQHQNDLVPRECPCIEYRPAFSTLHAKYAMSATAFREWIGKHKWQLNPSDEVWLHDQQWMGIESADLVFETEPAPNGKQLRAYHANGIAYISYNAF